MIDETEKDCEAQWGDGKYEKAWIYRLDVVLADDRVSKYPTVKRRLLSIRRHALKCNQERLHFIQMCKNGFYDLKAKWNRKRKPELLLGLQNKSKWWSCPTKYGRHEASCPFCQDDWRTMQVISEKLTQAWKGSGVSVKSWGDLTIKNHPYTHDFSDPAIQKASRDCVVLAGVSCYLKQPESLNAFYYVLVNDNFVKVKPKEMKQ
tara:strand:- start:256 stop:870 length:615 start_codon:yes stop_codon:yes gene_type:complete